MHVKIKRFANNPIITPKLDARIGKNINGPSLIRVPEWLPDPLGRYYLYFAHHQGTYIRLAYADALEGPWRIYTPGTLQLAATMCTGHIASPDVHVDDASRQLIMYYHGPVEEKTYTTWKALAGHNQCSFVATSPDGINFSPVTGQNGTRQNGVTTPIGPSYLRAFYYQDWVYALCMPGLFLRSRDGLHNFESGPQLFDENMRHAAVKVTGDTLHIFYSSVGDAPERILYAQIDLRPHWEGWQTTAPITALIPETEYEGIHLEVSPSQRGAIHVPVRQLRDPAIFEENDGTYLLYAVAGEQGIAIATLDFTR
jgi:hypothetical protein